ncbi:MAG: tyrosine--tRNA ligase, partial [Eubacterium sp.]|nr:tyrosine--tRNA ligase [Eubacterium sp.]
TTQLSDDDFTDGEITVLDMMLKAGMIKSKGEGRRLIDQGGVSVNDEKVNGALTTLKASDFDNEVIVKKGKKMFRKFTK